MYNAVDGRLVRRGDGRSVAIRQEVCRGYMLKIVKII